MFLFGLCYIFDTSLTAAIIKHYPRKLIAPNSLNNFLRKRKYFHALGEPATAVGIESSTATPTIVAKC